MDTVKIRIGFSRELHEFESRNDAFSWVRDTQDNCVISVLVYERGELVTMDRYHFDGRRFTLENIRS